jgi:chorismate mutase
MEIWEHILIISIPVIFVILIKFIRGAETYAEEQDKEIQTLENKTMITENHYHTHDNRVVNIIVKDGTELKTVLSKKANQTKLLGEE